MNTAAITNASQALPVEGNTVWDELDAESAARRYVMPLMEEIKAVEQRLKLRDGTLACWSTIEQNADTDTQKLTYWRDLKAHIGGTVGCLAELEGVDINAELGRTIY